MKDLSLLNKHPSGLPSYNPPCSDFTTTKSCINTCYCRWCFDKNKCLNTYDAKKCGNHTLATSECKKEDIDFEIVLIVVSSVCCGGPVLVVIILAIAYIIIYSCENCRRSWGLRKHEEESYLLYTQ